MPQHLVHPDGIRGDRFTIEGPEAHHLIRVLRKEPGDVIEIFDGTGGAYRVEIDGVYPDLPRVSGKILERLARPVSACSLRLFQGLARATRFDYVIEKAVELGVNGIVAFESSHSVVKLSEEQTGPKLERWRRVAQAAAKQCGRSALPRIDGPVPFGQLPQQLKGGLTLVLSEKEDRLSLKHVLRSQETPTQINLVVGPEGGFSRDELQAFKGWGAETVSLGRRILRTETAGLAALAIVNYELDLF